MKKLFALLIIILSLCVSSLCFAAESTETSESKKPSNEEKNPKQKQGDKFKNNIGMEFVFIEPRKFMMGSKESPEELSKKYNVFSDIFEGEKQHEVELTEGFYMQTTEVTQGQWKKVMKTEPWKGKDYVKEEDDYPAVCVSWKEAKVFCEKLSKAEETYRLPTEAEWEYACRAGTKTAYYWGDKIDTKYCWYRENTWSANEKYVHKGTTKESNKWGLYDMSGNIWEWCEDWYCEYPSESVTDPKGATSGAHRVIRGGSWLDNPWACRSASRYRFLPEVTDVGSGFRVVLTSE